jgi:peptidoglycan-associated lipoprotein
MFKKLLILMAVVSLALFQVNCATKKHVKTEVDRIDQEMGKIESSVEANETRIKEHDSIIAQHGEQISQLSKESQEAMERLQKTEKLAQGKLLYEITLTDQDVKFASGKATLSPTAKDNLLQLINNLKAENKNVYIEIQGHTDSQGSEEYNMRLGMERAETVRGFLSENGIPLHRISTISYGETRPVAPNNTKAGRAQNRRVVVQVLE